jgi:TldD protein
MNEISRRKFIKVGAGGLALISIPYIFKANPLLAMTGVEPQDAGLNDYLQHFEIDEKLIRDLISAALEKGGDYCDVFFEHTLSSSVGLEDDIVNRASTGVALGVGIRVLEGDQTGYSFTEDMSREAMILAAKTASNIAHDAREVDPVEYKAYDRPSLYRIETPAENVGIDQKVELLKTVNSKVRGLDSRIIKSQVFMSNSATYMLVATSEGRIAYDYQPMLYIYSGCTAEINGRKEQNKFDLAGRYGMEFLDDKKIDRLASESVKCTIALFEAGKPPAGEMELILAAGSSGILLHEAIGHGMEADCNRKNESIFSDKIGKPVAEKFVTIVDNGTNPNLRGTINVDDEANDTQETYLVRNGILESYLHDRISSRYYGVKPTGSGRRQSFRFAPIPRMRNTYMLNGPHSKEEIVKSVKKGVIAETFTNGEVRIGPGDFTFYVKSGYLIEDGKITMPIKDFNIIGNGPDVLKKITMVADDLEMAEGGWTCGKSGQSVPVSMGQPTVKVSSITVGGINS